MASLPHSNPKVLRSSDPSPHQATWSRWPEFDEEQIAAATEVLRSGRVNYWTGDEGRRFEAEFAEYTGCKHAVAVANGTVALELALLATGVGEGDEVIAPPRTFIATASSVVARGARPVFADVDPRSQNITAESIAEHVTARTKAIIVVHLAGWPADMDPIMQLAKRHGLMVIEDCAQAHGACYKGRPIGSLGHVGAFSFCQDKIMTTAGEGGMLVTNSETFWRKAWSYKDHGKSYQAVYQQEHPPGFRWVHENFGTNMRMTEVQAAVGRIALRRLPSWVEMRRRNAALLTEAFASLAAVQIPAPPADVYHSYYKFYALLNLDYLRPGWDRDRIAQAITSSGVPCFSGSCSEIYLEKAFPAELRPAQRLSSARQLGERSLMFLVDPTLAEQKIRTTAEIASRVLGNASNTASRRSSAPQAA
ncbi:MAG: DegT/DnrJ/EryC1/StrS aminotransferase family protein [Pirellulales bacterium]|nr:DegT/DnrJ/EryC1/StrS aminotransferase family protein [Pirellulales bacterium]